VQEGEPAPAVLRGSMSADHLPAPGHFGRRLLIICAIVALGLFCLVSFFSSRHWDGFESVYAARYGLVLLFIALSLAAARKRLTAIAVELLTWLVVMLVLVAGYSYRYELQDLAHRVRAELVPARGTETAPGVVSFTRGSDGQFWIDAQVDGRPVRFLVDTGASGVVLSLADAARIGYSADRLAFTQTADTANGRTREAPVVLDQVKIGSIRFERVPASVSAGGLRDSLLGMHLLERLSSIEIRKDTLTIRE
jgi:aspartyl protease family protein